MGNFEPLPGYHLSDRNKHTPAAADGDTWRSFGLALLAFHYRVELTAMCRCGRTVTECDVLAQARAHKLIT